MTINTAIEQLLEIAQAREDSSKFYEHLHYSNEFQVWIMCFLIVLIDTYLKFGM